MADVATLRIQFEGAQTINDLKRLQKEVRNTADAATIGTRQRTEADNLLVSVGNKLAGQRALQMTDNAKMMKSYFGLGEQLRHTRMEMVALAESSGIGPRGLSGIFAGMAGTGGSLTMLLGAFTSYVYILKDAIDETTKLSRELDDLEGKHWDRLLARLSYLRNPSWLDRIPGGTTALQLGLGLAQPSVGAAMLVGKGELENKVERAKTEEEISQFNMKNFLAEYDAFKKYNEEQARGAKLQEERIRKSKEEADQIDKLRGPYGPSPFRVLRGGRVEQLRQWSNEPGSFGFSEEQLRAQDMQFMADKNRGILPGRSGQEKKVFEEIKEGAIEAGSAITQYIGGAIRSSLDDAGNLALTIIGIAARTALIATGNAAYAGLVPFASGGSFYTTGPGFIPTSQGLAMVGESGPERIDVSPAREARRYGNRGGGVNEVPYIAETRIRGEHLVIAFKRANPIYNQGTL